MSLLLETEHALTARKKIQGLRMHPVKTRPVRTKSFATSNRFLGDTEVTSNSIIGSVLGVKRNASSKSRSHSHLENPYHSRELLGIPPTLPLDPIPNEELRINSKFDDPAANVFLYREVSVCFSLLLGPNFVDSESSPGLGSKFVQLFAIRESRCRFGRNRSV